jgi:hypothetical protein
VGVQVSNEALIHVLRSCPSLVKLNLARCKQLKSEVLVAAAQNCPELQQLVLSWCPRVSAPAIVQLGTPNPHHTGAHDTRDTQSGPLALTR